jgi:hypothetical protein
MSPPCLGLRRNLLLVACCLAALGCAHTKAQRPGTGVLAFRVHWQGHADVDLAVTTPLGEHVDFGKKTAPSGGRLDIDCNYSSARIEDAAPGAVQRLHGLPEIDRHLCAQPMENIFWPQGKGLPPGLYRVLLYIANPEPPPAGTDAYTLEVIVRGDVKLRRSGRVADLATAHIDQLLEIR